MSFLNFGKKNNIEEGIVESFFECVRDGLTIRGTEYRPEGENLPVAIVSHGFMANQDTVRHYAKILAGLRSSKVSPTVTSPDKMADFSFHSILTSFSNI